MKTYSDIFSCLKRVINQVGSRLAATVLFMVAAVTMSFAQDITIVEGSIGSYSVENHEGNTFFWTLNDETFKVLDSSYTDFFGVQDSSGVTVQFMDLNRKSSELVFLTVTETGKTGCSTSRALSIEIEPNNMYLVFNDIDTKECYTNDDYLASLNVGINFMDEELGRTIPEDRFPLNVRYSIVNLVTNDTVYHDAVIEYNEANQYALLVTDAKGEPDQTITYELEIRSVVDKYSAVIKNDGKESGYKMQIRVINHLPQTGNMEMAMAYSVVMQRM